VQVKTYIVYIIYMYSTQQDAPHRNEVYGMIGYKFVKDLEGSGCDLKYSTQLLGTS
jgi:hypothetical protein